MELVVVSGPDTGKRIDLSGARSIGRDAANDFSLQNGVVSGRHALIHVTPDGTVELTDFSSMNGTWVNGTRIEGSAVLQQGATIQIGENILVIEGWAATNRPGLSFAPNPPNPYPDPTAHMNAPSANAFNPGSVQNAGPVAGGDISISGDQAAGRDLHYHEGFRIKSRMTPSARRTMNWGIFFFFAGTLVGLIGMGFWFGGLAGTFSDGVRATESQSPEFPDVDTDNFLIGVILFGVGAVMNLLGLVMIIVSLVRRREQIREPVKRRR